MPTINLVVAQGSDDGNEPSGGTPDITSIYAQVDDGQWGGARFQNVTVPQGATIDSATFQVYLYSTASDSPAMILLRFGKFSLSGLEPLINSVISPPCCIMRPAMALFSCGYILSSPCARTPTVFSPCVRALRCAQVSIP